MKLKYQIALLVTGVVLLIVPFLLRRRAPAFVRKFFTTPADPINLAVFRIFFFLFLILFLPTLNVEWYSRMPRELLFPPPGLEWLLSFLPISEPFVKVTSVLFLICCFMSMIGLFTRTSIFLVLILGLYLLGIPQFYGKINHYHHLLWFVAILCVSPCADVLSFDAIFASWRRADRGLTEPPKASLAYSLPLRFMWLLMGAIYFSSGIWKAWTGGYRWAFSDNMRNILYNKWMELGDWTPFFRIDQYPIFYKFSAAATIAFELSFIVLIFFPILRAFAALSGLLFHNMIYLLMKINFYPLQICYVSFVNWRAFFHYVGRRLFPEELLVVYDGNCQLCRRTIASLRTLDILGRVGYVNALDERALESNDLQWADTDALLRDMYAFKGKKSWAGFAAYRVIAARIPVLWSLLPFLYLWPVPSIANRFYRRVADHRACSLVENERPDAGALTYNENRPRIRAIVIVGALLFYLHSLSAVVKFHSWPISAYPTFEDLDEPKVAVITMTVDFPSGQVIEISPIKGSSQMAPERLMGLLGRILSVEDKTEREARLNALWKLWVRDNPSLQEAVKVRFFKDVLSSFPERRKDNLISRELLAELNPT